MTEEDTEGNQQANPLSTVSTSREIQNDGIQTRIEDISIVPRFIPVGDRGVAGRPAVSVDDAVHTLETDNDATEDGQRQLDEAFVHDVLSGSVDNPSYVTLLNTEDESQQPDTVEARVRYDVVVTVAEDGVIPKKFYSGFGSRKRAEREVERLHVDVGDDVTVCLDSRNEFKLEHEATPTLRKRLSWVPWAPLLLGALSGFAGVVNVFGGDFVSGVPFLAASALLFYSAYGGYHEPPMRYDVTGYRPLSGGIRVEAIADAFGGVSPDSDIVSIEFTETDDAVVLSEVDGDRTWSAPKRNGFLTEQSVAFFEEMGVESSNDGTHFLTARKTDDENVPTLAGDDNDYFLFPTKQ